MHPVVAITKVCQNSTRLKSCDFAGFDSGIRDSTSSKWSGFLTKALPWERKSLQKAWDACGAGHGYRLMQYLH